MTLPAKHIIQQVAIDLNDRTSIRWPVPDLCRYFNDGQRQILVHRPDAKNVRITNFATVAGFRQTLPANAEKLIAVNANTNGRAITPVNRALLDNQAPNWRALPPVNEALHVMYDEREPKQFEVYPPVNAGRSLDLEYTAQTDDIAIPSDGSTFDNVTGNMSISALFANALRNYVMFRCYSKQTELGDPTKANGAYQLFLSDLGVEAQATQAVSPDTQPSQ